ncbi:hypothetical protein FHS90_001507 [Rufibacter quisquiliarum]|uniref:Uncharacterized protein n=1 Tax=Rufibacter quisquiliarum TaxID=1549639 RepID=A0A839GJ73_9BACT|nr:hypothetical protein [Rufibacter quisquiliarum]
MRLTFIFTKSHSLNNYQDLSIIVLLINLINE